MVCLPSTRLLGKTIIPDGVPDGVKLFHLLRRQLVDEVGRRLPIGL